MELLTIREAIGTGNNINCHSKCRNILKRYMDFGGYENIFDEKTQTFSWKEKKVDTSLNKKVVVAYRRNVLGCVFIIKAKVKYFSFIQLYKSNSYNTFKIDNLEAIKLIGVNINETDVEPSHIAKIEAVEMVNKLKSGEQTG